MIWLETCFSKWCNINISMFTMLSWNYSYSLQWCPAIFSPSITEEFSMEEMHLTWMEEWDIYRYNKISSDIIINRFEFSFGNCHTVNWGTAWMSLALKEIRCSRLDAYCYTSFLTLNVIKFIEGFYHTWS